MALRGDALGNAAGTASHSLTKPAGTVDDDIAYFWMVSDSNALTPTWPSGATELGSISPLITNVLDAMTFRVARKVCSGEPASWTIQGSVNIKGGVIVVSGRDTTTPEHQQSGVADTTDRPTAWTATSGAFATNTTIDGCDILFFQADDVNDSGGTVTHTPPSGFTLVHELSGNTFMQGGVSILEAAGVGESGVYAGNGADSLGTVHANLAMAVIAVAPSGPAPELPPERGRKLATQQRMLA